MPATDKAAGLTVEDCMSADVVTVPSSAMLDRAAQTMVERKVGSALIVDSDTLVGIITERDVLRAVARGLVPWSTPVSECMTPNPLSVEPFEMAHSALATMLARGFRHLPVLGDAGIVGIVSLRDLAGRVEPTGAEQDTSTTG